MQILISFKDRIDKLHQSQVKAYRDFAIRSIKDWASSLPLQPMVEGDTKESFVERCVSAGTTIPNWQLPDTTVTAINEIRKRAISAYEKYNPVEKNIIEAEEAEGFEEISEDDKEDGEVGPTVIDTVVETKTKQPSKNTHQHRKKRKGDNNNNKNASVWKKPTFAKGGHRNKGGPATRKWSHQK